jgi:hypothetical protein
MRFGVKKMASPYCSDCTNRFDECDCDERVKRAQIIINEAIKQVHELGCGLVADGTIEGNGVWFDTLRVQDRQST